MRSAYFDTVCGASGDMILAALLNAGAPLDALRSDLGRLAIPGLRIDIETRTRHGMAAAHLTLAWDTPKSYRHMPEILAIIEAGGFGARVNDRARAVLTRLAEAEAAVHGTTVDRVHFHEIGAVDTIVDVAGVALCLEYLQVERILFSTLTDGHGTVRSAHGEMPVPVPATARMIQGMAFRGLDVHGELLTPTGAALLTALGTQRVGLPEGIIEGCGVGCGDRDVETHANVLRVFLLSDEGAAAGEERVCVLESDMDHIGGEIMAFAAEECLHSGALDVSWTPIVMKKGRPGCRLTVLCAPPERDALIALIVMHTRTLGVRWHEMRRSVAGREHGETPAAQGTVRNKQCRFGDYAFCKPEYEDMARIARDEHRSILDVYEQYTGGHASPRGD